MIHGRKDAKRSAATSRPALRILPVGDIGRNNIEEVDMVLPGENYGWTKREGTFVHLQIDDDDVGEGYITGVDPLPANEATLGYTS